MSEGPRRPNRDNSGEACFASSVHQTTPTEFAAALRAARTRAGLPQAELAARLGVRQQHVSRLERGERLPSLPTYFALVDALALPSSLRLRPASEVEMPA